MNTAPPFNSENDATLARSWINRAFLMGISIVVALVLATLAIFLFRPALKPSQLAGSYHCDYSYGVETLTLNSDFTYTKSYAPNSGQALVNKGTWTMNADGQLVLDNAPCFDSGFNTPATHPITGLWILSIRRDVLSRIFFTVNEDCDLEFKPK